MGIARNKQYKFVAPSQETTKIISDFSSGLNTRDPAVDSLITKAQNARFGRGGGFSTRSGTIKKGNQIGTGDKIRGLHSYVKKDLTKQLLGSYNTDVYYYTETGSPNTIATSSNAQATGYSKDRHVFFTTVVDGSGYPYLVATYQSGGGILLEYSAYPYSSWANTPITIDTSTQIGWSFVVDTSDNIYVAYNSDSNTVKYVKLTYGAGPTWSVGSKVTVAGSGASDSAANPSISRATVGATTRTDVAFRYYNGSTYTFQYYTSTNGTSFSVLSNAVRETDGTAISSATANLSISLLLKPAIGTSSAANYYFLQYNNGTTWRYLNGYGQGIPSLTTSSSSGTLNAYSGVYTGTTLIYSISPNSSTGIVRTAYSNATGANSRIFDVVNDGVNDNDIQYRNVRSGLEDTTSTRVTNDSSNNLYPSVPLYLYNGLSTTPVVFTTGTTNPWSIKINNSTNWVALSASLTAGNNVESSVFPASGAGGTDQIYFVNGTNTAKKWDGTTLTSAAATNYPVAKQVCCFENRLWYFNLTSAQNRAAYTNSGADNFASPGTFPSGNIVDFPGYLQGGVVYRDHVMLVFTTEGIYAVQNFDYSGTQVGSESSYVKRIPNSYGTLSIRSVKQVGYWVYFQSPDGMIRRTNGQLVEEPACSDVILPTIQSFNLTQLQNAASGAFNDYYVLALPAAGSGKNSVMVVLDTRKTPSGGFSIDTGKTASCFVTHPNTNNQPEIFYGESTTTDGSIYQMETGTNDNGTAISLDVRTGILLHSYYKKHLSAVLPLADASEATLTIGVAKAASSDSYLNFTKDLSSGSSVWGIGTWGTGSWGGAVNTDDIIPIHLTDRGFSLKFANSTLDETINIETVALAYTSVIDSK